jgi:hypothetical protein
LQTLRARAPAAAARGGEARCDVLTESKIQGGAAYRSAPAWDECTCATPGQSCTQRRPGFRTRHIPAIH